MSKPARACIFCGKAADLSREHMWPVWTHRYLRGPAVEDPHTPRPQPSTRFGFKPGDDGLPGFGYVQVVDMVQGYIRNKTFPVVCRETCNGGWMKALEDQVSDFGGRMIRGEMVILTGQQVATLAVWASLRAMIMELADRTLIGTSEAQRHQLYETGRPPDTSRIWIGRYEGTEWDMRVRHTGLAGTPVPVDGPLPKSASEMNVQATTFVIGQLLVYVFSTYLSGIDLSVWGGPVLDLTPIWPNPSGFTWPPKHVVGDAEAFGISSGLAMGAQADTEFALGPSLTRAPRRR